MSVEGPANTRADALIAFGSLRTADALSSGAATSGGGRT